MQIQTVKVPLALLLSPALTPSAKLLWISLHLDATKGRQRSHAPTHLARRTGLARSTVYEAIARASASGWLREDRHPPSGKRRWKAVLPHTVDRTCVEIPVDLVCAPRSVPLQAILCYGLLQANPEYRESAGQSSTGYFKWAEFSKLIRLHLRTVKRAVRRLVQAGWVVTAQENRLARIWFRLQHADQARKEDVQRRVERSKHLGEALMKESLTVLVDSEEFVDNARPGFLINPATREQMELDRYYPLHGVAFEFNGRQHYVATERFSEEQVAEQRKRDEIKRRICKNKEIPVVTVQAEDLSLATMIKKIGDLLPLRKLRGYDWTIQYLETLNQKYRRSARST